MKPRNLSFKYYKASTANRKQILAIPLQFWEVPDYIDINK